MAIINYNFLAQKLELIIIMNNHQNSRRDFLKKVCPTVAFAFLVYHLSRHVRALKTVK